MDGVFTFTLLVAVKVKPFLCRHTNSVATAGSKLAFKGGDFVGFLGRSENVTAEVVVIFVADSGEEKVIVVGQSGNVVLGEADILAKRIQDYVDFVLNVGLIAFIYGDLSLHGDNLGVLNVVFCAISREFGNFASVLRRLLNEARERCGLTLSDLYIVHTIPLLLGAQ